MTRDELIHYLVGGECLIKFTKVDGSVRVMRATLKEELLPAKVGAKKDTPINIEILRVYDLEKQGWRSFKIASLKSISVI